MSCMWGPLPKYSHFTLSTFLDLQPSLPPDPTHHQMVISWQLCSTLQRLVRHAVTDPITQSQSSSFGVRCSVPRFLIMSYLMLKCSVYNSNTSPITKQHSGLDLAGFRILIIVHMSFEVTQQSPWEVSSPESHPETLKDAVYCTNTMQGVPHPQVTLHIPLPTSQEPWDVGAHLPPTYNLVLTNSCQMVTQFVDFKVFILNSYHICLNVNVSNVQH